ncbi:class I SAM-dependent methyltransferase [Streptomyces sp. FR-108]|uniref:class I SAM-dependent methyltransferase n=1 Tax=Streptomyces sp. FR-108 TaxID=3416665 RepID=UPI003CEA465C
MNDSPVSDLVPPQAQPAWAGADPYTRALRTGHGPLFLRRSDGWLLPLEVERWCARADAVDLEILDRCEGSVLDIGCGPGRLVAELAGRGRRVLGIDVSAAAVSRTERLGGPALRRSVFEPLPAEGRWDTALLVDGNIGIGGDPPALLARLTDLLVPAGLLIAETVPVDVDERVHVHITDARGPDAYTPDPYATNPHDPAPYGLERNEPDPRRAGPHEGGVSGAVAGASAAFPWARIGTRALVRYATRAGWTVAAQWTAGGRSFVALRSRNVGRGLSRDRNNSADPAKRTAVISSQRPRKTSAGSPVAIRYRRST